MPKITIDNILGYKPVKSPVERLAVPAYGRSYKNANEVMSDWRAGKDFKFANGGPYFSIRDSQSLAMYTDIIVVTDNRGSRLAEINFVD